MLDRRRIYRLRSRLERRSNGGPDAGFLDVPLNRYLLSLLISLLLVLGVSQIQFLERPKIGWKVAPSNDPTSFDLLPPEYSRRQVRELIQFDGGVPITQFAPPEEATTMPEEGDTDDPVKIAAAEDSLSGFFHEAKAIKLEELKILEFAEEQPDIIGGLSSLYLRIRYPKAAQESGIEGLVLLSFVVETDGTTSSIRILKTLHPLCDQAAVDAISETLFTPARQNGKRVRVRMHLPIRFVLIDDSPDLMVESDVGSSS